MEPSENPQTSPPPQSPPPDPTPPSASTVPVTPAQRGSSDFAQLQDPEDEEILVIKRHPFGLVVIYFQAIFGTAVALGLLYFAIPAVLSGDSQDRAMQILSLITVVIVTIVILVLFAATYIYRKSRWVVTNDSVHQLLQRGLFNYQTSELSMANIEDVTAEQKGILAELFGFGTLRAETAGELPYFHFNYCPTPDKYAQIILQARERYVNTYPEEAKRANDNLNAPGVRR